MNSQKTMYYNSQLEPYNKRVERSLLSCNYNRNIIATKVERWILLNIATKSVS